MTDREKTNVKRRVSEDGRLIARNLKQLREVAGLTQQDVAQMLEITHQQVQKYESGLNRLSLQMVPALCDALGVSMESLLAGTIRNETARAPHDLLNLQTTFMRVRNPAMRQKILQVVDILAA
jgi:transcriptional regulator with XRE-family HTH domain